MTEFIMVELLTIWQQSELFTVKTVNQNINHKKFPFRPWLHGQKKTFPCPNPWTLNFTRDLDLN